MAEGAIRRQAAARGAWAVWAFALPFAVTCANLWYGTPVLAHSTDIAGLWVLVRAMLDGLLTGLAAVFFLRGPLAHRAALGVAYAGLMTVLLAVFALFWLVQVSPAALPDC